MSNIVSLSGDPIPAPGEADPKIVEICESLLEMASSGEIIGIAASVIRPDDTATLEWGGRVLNLLMLGSLDRLKHTLNTRLDGRE